MLSLELVCVSAGLQNREIYICRHCPGNITKLKALKQCSKEMSDIRPVLSFASDLCLTTTLELLVRHLNLSLLRRLPTIHSFTHLSCDIISHLHVSPCLDLGCKTAQRNPSFETVNSG